MCFSGSDPEAIRKLLKLQPSLTGAPAEPEPAPGSPELAPAAPELAPAAPELALAAPELAFATPEPRQANPSRAHTTCCNTTCGLGPGFDLGSEGSMREMACGAIGLRVSCTLVR